MPFVSARTLAAAFGLSVGWLSTVPAAAAQPDPAGETDSGVATGAPAEGTDSAAAEGDAGPRGDEERTGPSASGAAPGTVEGTAPSPAASAETAEQGPADVGGRRASARRATPPMPNAPAVRTQPEAAPLPNDAPHRPVPDYDGRGEPPTTAGDVLLWVPRVLVSPLYLVSEFVVRRPLGALVTLVEKDDWIAILGDFFTFNKEQTVGIVPTAFLEFGFDPSVGLIFFADDAFTDGNDFSVQTGMWPTDWWSLSITDRWTNAADTWSVGGNVLFVQRPDYIYHGIGPFTRDEDLSRYGSMLVEATLEAEHRPWRESAIRARAGLRRQVFDATVDYSDDPSLQEAIRSPRNALSELPPGFDSGYVVAFGALDLVFDTRKPFPNPGHGVRVEYTGQVYRGTRDAGLWLRQGGLVGGFVDLRDQRVVSLSVWADFLHRQRGTVPFTELVSLGGWEPMPGFRRGRLLGRSRIGSTFEYRWPVWIWLDVALHYDVGNVFGPALEGFAFRHLRQSVGIGFRSARTSEPDSSLQFQIGVGTDTFERGSSIDTVRVLFGGSRGF